MADPGFLRGGCGGGLAPIFSEGMTPTFLQQIVSAHRRSQDFQRVGAPRGMDPGFLVGDDGGAEGPERGAVGAKRRSAEGVRPGEGRRSPYPVWGSGGYAPRKFLKFNLQICAF